MGVSAPISPPKSFPYCIVWTPIPLISWVLPFVGHMGLGMSDGVILDFAGPYHVSVDDLAFGNPTKYLRLDPSEATYLTRVRPSSTDAPQLEQDVASAWDAALQAAVDVYQLRMYNFLGDNCHGFVSHFLNSVAYEGRHTWHVIWLAALMFVKGSFVDAGAVAKSWVPFTITMAVGLLFWRQMFLLVWLGFFAVVTGWFAIYSWSAGPKVASPPCITADDAPSRV